MEFWGLDARGGGMEFGFCDSPRRGTRIAKRSTAAEPLRANSDYLYGADYSPVAYSQSAGKTRKRQPCVGVEPEVQAS